MEHSDRNDVVPAPGGVLVKRHGGPDGVARAAVAAVALRQAADSGLPVPAVRAVAGRELRMEAVQGGVSGAAALATWPAEVLAAIGTFARDLHAVAPPDGVRRPDGVGDRAGDGAVWVHGDLCPVNVLFDADGALAAVVDWEDSHVGEPLVDLAWTEWLVHTWHPRAVPQLPELYAAYDAGTPPADDRRRAMAACLVRHRAREATSSGRAVWDQHLADLEALDLAGLGR